MENKKSAGFFLLLIAVYQFSVWVIFLVVSRPPCTTWKDELNALLTPENELMPWFIASLVATILSFTCAIIYYSKLSNSQSTLMALLIVCTAQALSAIWFLDWFLKVLYSLPVIFGYLAYKNPNKLAAP